jgi:ATP-dependent RNA helicase DOB1
MHVTKLEEEPAALLRVMLEQAKRIAKEAKEPKLPIMEDKHVSFFKIRLSDAVVQWCRSVSFSDLCARSVRL